MAIIFLDDFETGDGRLWDIQDDSATYSPTAAHEGGFGYIPDISQSDILRTTISETDKAFVGFWIYIDSITSISSTLRVLLIVDSTGDGDGLAVSLRKSGADYQAQITLGVALGSTASSWYTVPSDEWAFISVACILGTTSRAALCINALVQECISLGSSTCSMDSLRFGIPGDGLSSGTIYLDTIAVGDSHIIYPLYDHGEDVFIIHPKGRPSVVCTIGNADVSNNFVVLAGSIDSHDDERSDIVIRDGLISPLCDQGTVDFEFMMLLFGANYTEAMSNERILRSALANPDGGTIEYKPPGAGRFSRNTFYHYEASSPALTKPGTRTKLAMDARIKDSASTVGLEISCKVKTRTVCTSDPDDPVQIYSGSVGNYATATPPNRIVINDFLVIGSGVLPIFTVDPTKTDGRYGGVIMYKYTVPVGDESCYGWEWMEAESSMALFRLADWSVQTLPSHSGGNKLQGGTALYFESFRDAKMYCAGKVTPILIGGFFDSSATYTLWWERREPDGSTPAQDMATIGSSITQNIMEFPTADLPPFAVGDYDDDDIIEDVVGPLCIGLSHDSVIYAEVDALVLLPSWDWLVALAAPEYTDGVSYLDYDIVTAGPSHRTNQLVVDVPHGSAHVIDGTVGYKLMQWGAQGSLIEQLVLSPGEDSLIGFIFNGGIRNYPPLYDIPHKYTGYYDARSECDVTVTGVFVTTVPFEEP